MSLGLLARKRGMTRYRSESGEMIPVTVMVAGPCTVASTKNDEQHGYKAVQFAFEALEDEKRYNKPDLGQFKKSGVAPHRVLGEFRCGDEPSFELGQTFTASVFQPGDRVKVRGRTKGRGFQGVIKRWGKHGGPASHGSHFHRSTGSIGMCSWPSRVFKNMKMPGHLGDENVTTSGLEVIAVCDDTNTILLRGAVPGAKNGLVRIEGMSDDFATRFVVQAPAEDTAEDAATEDVAGKE